MKFDAVLFDLGGTLFEHLESTTSTDNLRSAYERLPTEVREGADAATFVSSYRRLRAVVEHQFLERRFYLHRDLVAHAFVRAVLELAPTARDAPSVRRSALAFCAQQRQSVVAHLRPRDDMGRTLVELKRRGVPCGIVSNIDEDYLVPLVAKHDLASHFEFCLSSEAAGFCKPHKDFFYLALSRLSMPAPRVLFVGDSLPHDVAGANAVGMSSCWLRSANAVPEASPQPHYVVDCLGDVLECLT